MQVNQKEVLGDAGYGRSKVVTCEVAMCDKCNGTERVLSFDSSDDEYGSVSVCRRCFLDMIGPQ